MFRTIIEVLATILRGRPVYFDTSISLADLFGMAFRNCICLIRGMISFRKVIAVGRGAKLVGKRNLRIGSGVTIGDFVVLDAIGLQGLDIGHSSSIGSYSIIKVSGSLRALGLGINIGGNVGISEFAHIGGAGGFSIGHDTIIGSYFSAHPENHVYADITQPIRLQGVTHIGIRVGHGCWIGAKVTLLDGAVIGDGCIVAAGAVVKGEFPDNCVIGGVPAKLIKFR